MLAPGMWATDVVNKRKSPIFCFLGQEYERYMGWKKDRNILFFNSFFYSFLKDFFCTRFSENPL
jgi:hypothetical protein